MLQTLLNYLKIGRQNYQKPITLPLENASLIWTFHLTTENLQPKTSKFPYISNLLM